MSLVNLENLARDVRENRALLESSAETIQSLQQNVQNLGTVIANTPPPSGQIDNLLRNSVPRHSWDTWCNTTPVAGDQQKEAAHIFTQEPDTAQEVFTGAITSGTPNLTIASDGDLFDVSNDAGKEIVVEGAGTSGANLVTTILSVSSTTAVVLNTNALTTVSNARVRWRLQTIAKTSTKTGTATVNQTLKSSDHSGFSSNIVDPRWNKSFGYVELGSKNTINFPIGFWNNTTNSFVFQNLIEPSKTLHFQVRVARKNIFIKPRGFIKVDLCDNSSGKKQIIEGGRFTLEVEARGTPGVTVSSEYKIIARDGYENVLESNIVTLNRPTDAEFITDVVYMYLSWGSVSGARIYEVWRRTGSTYSKLAEIFNGQTAYADNNVVPDVPVPASGFPASSGRFPQATAITQSGGLDLIIVDGDSFGWNTVKLPVNIPSLYNMTGTTEQWLRMYLTQECDREMTDGVADSTTTLTSATAAFEADDAGLTIIIDNGEDAPFETTINSITSATEIELDAAVPFTASNCTITIIKGGRNGLLFREFGLSLANGEYAANHDDTQAAQPLAANPSSGSSGGTGGGNGGINCIRFDMPVEMYSPPTNGAAQIIELPADNVQIGNFLFSGNIMPNCVIQKKVLWVDCLLEIRAGGKTLFCTPSHPMFRDFSGFDQKTPAHEFHVGDTIAQRINGRDELNKIEKILTHFGRFKINHFTHLAPGHIAVAAGFYFSNAKPGDGPIIVLT